MITILQNLAARTSEHKEFFGDGSVVLAGRPV